MFSIGYLQVFAQVLSIDLQQILKLPLLGNYLNFKYCKHKTYGLSSQFCNHNKESRKYCKHSEEIYFLDQILAVFCNETVCKNKVCEKFHINISSLNTILIQRDKFRKAFSENLGKMKMLRKGIYTEIELCLYEWVCNLRSSNIKINGRCMRKCYVLHTILLIVFILDNMMKAKANAIANQINLTYFKASNGYLYRFKQRSTFHIR